MRRWNNHIIAVSAIIAIITIMFWASGALEKRRSIALVDGEQRFLGEYFVRIVKANWGVNCNSHVERHNQARSDAQKRFVKGDDLPEILSPIPKNNALLSLSRKCDGLVSCEIPRVRSSTLDIEPFSFSCTKRLEVSYRCFEIDKLHTVTVRQNKALNIQCAPNKTEETS